jgi:hypothetical protein
MKIKYAAIAEMREAKEQFTHQLDEIQRWLDKLSRRVDACRNALDNNIIFLKDIPEKIDDLRSDLYEIDKGMEIVSVNCASLTTTQNKEENEQTGNGTSNPKAS